METIFDDIAKSLRAPRTDAWRPVRAFAIDMAGKLFLGVALDLGFGMAIAGYTRPIGSGGP
ncbi:hypothetical protein NKI46_29505 [Mesorhizobium sp. M0615]|uniref:hypothetical protein n=1 Tax=unclassified Mesorhizobium TaxID=325217 RepID=UPI0003CF68CE|nr:MULTISPECIES: hypothetical protein [unclassified Mesorhizobium]ESY10519.1 hypothetical protein X752_14785 [Mesorhizobium sp. LNJC398B00]ESY35840.1 hypothetical protein X748_15330 [Mesorhizobium sp. LNJC386A00]